MSRAPRANRGRRRSLPIVLGLCLAAATATGPALAADSGTAAVGPAAEAWYRATPACALPTGCVDVGQNPAPFKPGTLHVGVTAGQEQARTYVQLDLGAVPSGASPDGGTLLLPVASTQDGTRAPETAELRACAVTAEVLDAEGSFAKPPEVDCETASEAASFRAADGDEPAAFTVDLAALASAWEGSAQPGAVALLPAAETAPTDNWRVVLSQRERTGEGVVPISASLTFGSSSASSSSFDFGAGAPPVASAPFAPAPEFAPPPAFGSAAGQVDQGAGTTSLTAPLGAETPVVPAPDAQAAPAPMTAPAAQQAVPVASFVPSGFRYPAVFLLPLLLAAAAAWVGRALTQDLVGARP